MYRIIRSTLVVALSFLALTLILGSLDSSDVGFAKKAKVTRGPIECDDPDSANLIKCCQTETDSKGVEIKYCTICNGTDPPSNCGPRYSVSEIKTPPSDLPSVEKDQTKSPPNDHLPLATDNLEKQPSSDNNQLIGKSELDENIKNDNNPNNQHLNSDDNNKENDLE